MRHLTAVCNAQRQRNDQQVLNDHPLFTGIPFFFGGPAQQGPVLEDRPFTIEGGDVIVLAEAGLSSSPGVAYAIPAAVVKAAVERLTPKK